MKPNLSSAPGISLVIPFYNEDPCLEETLNCVWNYFQDAGIRFEILLGNDGSTDQSLFVAERFAAEHAAHVRLFSNPLNLGRGSVLKRAFEHASLPYVGYIDADLEIPVEHVGELLSAMVETSSDVGVGDKTGWTKSKSRQFHRFAGTLVLNGLLRWILNSRFRDHQCGLKIFARELLWKILPETQEKRWAFDTELLLLAQQNHARSVQIPITLRRKRKSTVSFVATAWMFLKKILEFRKRGLVIHRFP